MHTKPQQVEACADKSEKAAVTKSSVNFKALKSALHAVSHATRTVEPSYLLAKDKSMGTIVLLDDKGSVASTLEAKLALASRQALREKNYSPVWEGVLNLPRPEVGFDADEYKKTCANIVSSWCERYEASTRHKVLRADIHLDEGHMVDGESLLNAHAHIISDRTNDKGRVMQLSPKMLRELQTLTAEVTGLERGKSSLETGRKHISHQAYKYLAELGRFETQQQVEGLKAIHGKELDRSEGTTKIYAGLVDSQNARAKVEAKKLKDAQLEASKVPQLQADLGALTQQIAQLKEQYKLDRDAMKATGEAKQADYQALKKTHEAALASLTTVKVQAAKVPGLEAQALQQASELARYRHDREALKASGEATQRDYQALKVKHKAALLDIQNSNGKLQKMDHYSEKLKTDLVESNQKIAAALEAKAQAIEDLVKAGEKSEELLKTVKSYREDAAKIVKIAADFKAENVVLKAEIVEVKAKLETLAKTHQEEAAQAKEQASELRQLKAEYGGYREATVVRAAAEVAASEAKPVPTIQAMPSLGPNARAKLRAEQMALEATRTTLEAPKQVQEGIPSPTPSKTPREAFLELYGHIKTVLVGLIDGMRLDAVEGRLGLFSSHRSTGPRVQMLCEVPDDKVMPEIGKTFDGRARSGKGGIGD